MAAEQAVGFVQALEIVKAAGLVLGGGWALWVFTIQRRFAAMIEFDVEAKVLERDGDTNLLECTLLLTNRGMARQKVRKIYVTVRGIKSDAALTYLAEGNRLAFPETLASRIPLFPPKWEFTFIDPNITQRYMYAVSLPKDIDAVLVHGAFKYPNNWKHTAERIFSTKPSQPA